jgi:hypothetical protein
MREYFVSDETSKELKEFGFDKPCIAITINGDIFYGEFDNTHEEYDNGLILWQQAIDWLEDNKIYLHAFRMIGKWHWKRDVKEGYDDFSRGEGFETKYEALSEGLNRTLNILDEYSLENG